MSGQRRIHGGALPGPKWMTIAANVLISANNAMEKGHFSLAALEIDEALSILRNHDVDEKMR